MSLSCPTAETTGSGQPKIARTTASSLKAQRSSAAPPPRARITTSGGASGSPAGPRGAAAAERAAAISPAASGPCTEVGCTKQRRERPATLEHGAHVVEHGALRRGHHGDPARVRRERALARGIEEPLLLEAGAAPLELGGGRAGAGRLDEVDDELEIAPLLVEGEGAVGEERGPLLHPLPLAGVAAAEEDAAQGGASPRPA